MRSRGIVVPVVGVALALAGTFACTRSRPEGRAIVVALANSPINLDPRVGSDEASQKAHQLLYSTLVRIDGNLRVVPDLAESFVVADSITYVARLRPGVLFHNGRELTAEDVVYTFRSFLDPSFRGRSGAYRQLASVEAKDRYTVEFRLKEPFGSFPINLVMGIVQAGSGEANARQPIGTGPYRMTSFIQDDRLVLEPFDRYYGERAKNDGVVLKVVPDDTMRGLELRKGTVDLVVNDLAPDIVYQLQEEGRLGVTSAKGTDYAYMGLNQRDSVLRNAGVRRAIGYAVDREAIVKYLRRDFATVAVGIVPPMSWAFEKNVFNFTYDPHKRAGCSTRPAIRIPTAMARFPASDSRSRRPPRRSTGSRPPPFSTISRVWASRSTSSRASCRRSSPTYCGATSSCTRSSGLV